MAIVVGGLRVRLDFFLYFKTSVNWDFFVLSLQKGPPSDDKNRCVCKAENTDVYNSTARGRRQEFGNHRPRFLFYYSKIQAEVLFLLFREFTV